MRESIKRTYLTFVKYQGGESDDIDDEDRAAAVYVDRGFIINAPNLQRLVIHDLSVSLGTSYFDLLLKPLTKLTHLDLSGAEHREGFGHLVSELILFAETAQTGNFKTNTQFQKNNLSSTFMYVHASKQTLFYFIVVWEIQISSKKIHHSDQSIKHFLLVF